MEQSKSDGIPIDNVPKQNDRFRRILSQVKKLWNKVKFLESICFMYDWFALCNTFGWLSSQEIINELMNFRNKTRTQLTWVKTSILFFVVYRNNNGTFAYTRFGLHFRYYYSNNTCLNWNFKWTESQWVSLYHRYASFVDWFVLFLNYFDS